MLLGIDYFKKFQSANKNFLKISLQILKQAYSLW